MITSRKPHFLIPLPLGVSFHHVNFEGTHSGLNSLVLSGWSLSIPFPLITTPYYMHSNQSPFSFIILPSFPYLRAFVIAVPWQVVKEILGWANSLSKALGVGCTERCLEEMVSSQWRVKCKTELESGAGSRSCGIVSALGVQVSEEGN